MAGVTETYDPYSDGAQTAGAAAGGMIVMIILYLAMIALCVFMYYKLAKKAGYPGWYTILAFVPILNIVVMFLYVFKEWPIEQEVRALRAQTAGAGYGGYSGPQVAQAYDGYAAAAPAAAPQAYSSAGDLSTPPQGYAGYPSGGYPTAAPAAPVSDPYAAGQPAAHDPSAGAPSWYRPSS